MNGRYADDRNGKQVCDFEDLPNKKAIQNTGKIARGKIDFGPLIRFLGDRVGGDWDEIYSEIRARIPKKLLAYEDSVLRFVVTKVSRVDGFLINLENHRPIWTPETDSPTMYNCYYEYTDFYVDPDTHVLVRVTGSPFKPPRKKLGKNGLKARKLALQTEAKTIQSSKDEQNAQAIQALKVNKQMKKQSSKKRTSPEDSIDGKG
jgi:hypothetical protein